MKVTYAVGSVWMGIVMYLLIYTALAEAVLLVMRLAGRATGTAKLIAEAAVLLMTAVTVIAGSVHATRIRTARYAVDGGKGGESLKIVLVSDIHIGALGVEGRLQKMADDVSAQDADIVCTAGDVFNNVFGRR